MVVIGGLLTNFSDVLLFLAHVFCSMLALCGSRRAGARTPSIVTHIIALNVLLPLSFYVDVDVQTKHLVAGFRAMPRGGLALLTSSHRHHHISLLL